MPLFLAYVIVSLVLQAQIRTTNSGSLEQFVNNLLLVLETIKDKKAWLITLAGNLGRKRSDLIGTPGIGWSNIVFDRPLPGVFVFLYIHGYTDDTGSTDHIH